MKRMFQTVDGKLYDNGSDASAHEDHLFDQWVASNPTITVDELIVAAGVELKGEVCSALKEHFLESYPQAK